MCYFTRENNIPIISTIVLSSGSQQAGQVATHFQAAGTQFLIAKTRILVLYGLQNCAGSPPTKCLRTTCLVYPKYRNIFKVLY